VLELGEPHGRPGTVQALVENEPLSVVVELRSELGEPIGALLEW
jgi:hypothetical protein